MKALARHRTQDFIAGETLHSLAKRHDISRNLIRGNSEGPEFSRAHSLLCPMAEPMKEPI
jgi:hypothetical protein